MRDNATLRSILCDDKSLPTPSSPRPSLRSFVLAAASVVAVVWLWNRRRRDRHRDAQATAPLSAPSPVPMQLPESQAPGPVPSPAPETTLTLLQRYRKRLSAAVGVIVIVMGVIQFARFVTPAIHISSDSSLDSRFPFATRFTVTNAGQFKLYDVAARCDVAIVDYGDNWQVTNNSFDDPFLTPAVAILPSGMSTTAVCAGMDRTVNWDGDILPVVPKFADISITVAYRPLWSCNTAWHSSRFGTAVDVSGNFVCTHRGPGTVGTAVQPSAPLPWWFANSRSTDTRPQALLESQQLVEMQ